MIIWRLQVSKSFRRERSIRDGNPRIKTKKNNSSELKIRIQNRNLQTLLEEVAKETYEKLEEEKHLYY